MNCILTIEYVDKCPCRKTGAYFCLQNAARYCVALTFPFGHVRLCTLPSRKPCASCLACIFLRQEGLLINEARYCVALTFPFGHVRLCTLFRGFAGLGCIFLRQEGDAHLILYLFISTRRLDFSIWACYNITNKNGRE